MIGPNNGAVINVLSYIPVQYWDGIRDGTNTTDLTTYIQNFVTDLEVLGGEGVFDPGLGYIMGQITIASCTQTKLSGYGATITLSGSNAGFWLTGTITDFILEGFNVIGDGTSTSAQALIQNNSGQTLKNIKVLNNHVYNTRNGIALTSESSGSLTYVEYAGNYIDTMNGTAGGEGYGLFVANANNTAIYANIHHNVIINATRHSIYKGRGDNVTINNNIIVNHRNVVADLSVRAAISYSRGSYGIIANNMFVNCSDGCIHINADNTGANTQDIFVTGNNFLSNANNVAQITIGSTSPATDNGVLKRITINGNYFQPGTNVSYAIQFYHGKELRLTNNRFLIEATIGYALLMIAYGESGGSTTYSDDWTIKDNDISIIGATAYAFRFNPPFVTNFNGTVKFYNNSIVEGGAGVFSQSAGLNGPVIYVHDTPKKGIVWASGAELSGMQNSTRYGNSSITPDANGNGTIAHGLSSIPDYVSTAIRGDNANGVDVQTLDATNITVRIKDASGADVTTGTYTIDWLARV